MGILVFIAALILGAILLPIGFVYGIFEAFVNRGFKQGFIRLEDHFYDAAFSIDQLGNAVCQELFDDTLIKASSKHRFGNPDETISSVLGRNKKAGTLTRTGKVLDYILDKLDKNHSIKAIGF